ncbi:MAG: lipid-A-disaccharide synthase [Verrucomicrobiales bacterium]|nr:lipid-A-disaccharide synthase [Verrucomicrobiales bacterium]
MPSLYFVSGERSGDRHGAGLMEALRSRSGEPWTFSGLGGPQMHALAPEVRDWVEEAGVVGLWEVLRKYGWFKRRFDETLQGILATAPDAVVLIDYPGFNLRMAKALRAAAYPGKILYYISPQVWAWQRSRIPKMAQWLDLMMCIFPFEKELYEGQGLKTEFTGHPLVAWHRAQDRGLVREENLIGLFPGSRRREIVKLFPVLLGAAQMLQAMHPHLRFVASAASPKLEALMRQMLVEMPVDGLVIETGTVYDLMRRCTAGAVASGTATLEAAILGLPHCLVYRVAWPTYAVGKMVIRVDWLGIVNILAGKEVVRELLQSQCTPQSVAAELARLADSPPTRDALRNALGEVVAKLGSGDAYARAAEIIGATLDHPW